MRTLTTLLTVAVLVLVACQKEVNFATNNGSDGGNNSGSLLVKMVAKTGSDSLVNTYGYDANKRAIDIKTFGIDQGTPTNKEYRIYRNSAGIITQYSTIDADLVAQGLDSFVTVVHYDASHSRYTSYVISVNASGFILLDSSTYVYDGSGNIVEEDVYESPSGLNSDYYYTGKVIYTYSNGNITELDIHDVDQTGVETFSAKNVITYDSKTSPYHFGIEGFPLGHQEWVTPNNIAGETLSDSGGAADNQTVSWVYVYNSEGKPASAVVTYVSANPSDNFVSNFSYYYQ